MKAYKQVYKHKIACVIFAIFIALSGLFVQGVEESSYIAEMTDSTVYASVISVGTIPLEEHLGTIDMFQTQNLIGVKSSVNKVLNKKSGVNQTFSFLCSNVFSLKQGAIFESSVCMKNNNSSPKELVVKYIHKSDGKKRI